MTIDFEKFKQEWNDFNPNMDIQALEFPITTRSKIQCNCHICNGTYESKIANLKMAIKRNSKFKGCRICSGQQIEKGINDFATLHPELMKYIVNPKDVENVASSTNKKKILTKCDKCGSKQEKNIYDLIRYGFKCNICDDGITFPNKILRSFMLQLPVFNLKFEYKSNWTQNKIYDCYFEYNNQKYVIEMDGEQHFRDAFYQSYEERHQNDLLKDKIAEENNIIMIRINCSNGSYEQIYANIINSLLFTSIFNKEQVNWEKCKDFISQDSLLIQVCQYYNENFEPSTEEMAQKFNISKTTVLRYLNKGKELELCNFTGHLRCEEGARKARGKIQLVYDLNNNFIGEYQTITELRTIFPELSKRDTDRISYAQNHGQKKVQIKNYYFERKEK